MKDALNDTTSQLTLKSEEGFLHNKNNELTTCSSVILEKLIVPLQVNKFSAFYWQSQIVAVFTKARLNPDDYPVFSRPLLILYSHLRLRNTRKHKNSNLNKTHKRPIIHSAQLQKCLTVSCNWFLIICSFVNCANITTFLCTNDCRQLFPLFQLTVPFSYLLWWITELRYRIICTLRQFNVCLNNKT